MQRHARTKFRKKGGAPLMGMMNTRLHEKAHEKMGMGGGSKKDNAKSKLENFVEQGPGNAPENKKKNN